MATMSEFRVHLKSGAYARIQVEAEDAEAAIEKALELVPHEVCAQCSGWNRGWSRGFDGEQWEVDEVLDDKDQVVAS
jgi:hypothetical protein